MVALKDLVAISNGSDMHFEQLTTSRSHVLRAMGMDDDEANARRAHQLVSPDAGGRLGWGG